MKASYFDVWPFRPPFKFFFRDGFFDESDSKIFIAFEPSNRAEIKFGFWSPRPYDFIDFEFDEIVCVSVEQSSIGCEENSMPSIFLFDEINSVKYSRVKEWLAKEMEGERSSSILTSLVDGY